MTPTTTDMPAPIAALIEQLAKLPDIAAVTLGGSRATGVNDANSDWDIGLYYRHSIDLSALAHLGDFAPPGAWGRIMNGGAWLQVGGQRVDVLLRDLDVVEHWTQRAQAGEFDVDALLGYVAGAPTYLLAAELGSCRVLHGALPASAFPAQLRIAAPPRWRFCRTFSAAYARAHAKRGNLAGAMGQLSKAAMEEAHAVLCERGEWVCNEKRLLDAAGLGGLQALFAQHPLELEDLMRWVDDVAGRLGCRKDEMPPWAID